MIQEIKGIKSELKEIKYHIGINGGSQPSQRNTKIDTQKEEYEYE